MVHTHTSVKKSKKHRPVVSSTSPSNPGVIPKTPQSGTSVFDGSNSFYSTEKQFLIVLRSLEPLPKWWESDHTQSCKAFTDLATCILQCSQGKMPDCLGQADIPVEAVCLMRQGHYVQAIKICHGYAIETGFCLVETHLTHMTGCIAQLKTWLERLSAIETLSVRTHRISQSPSSASLELSDLSSLVLWPAVIGETRGLLSRLEQDIDIRRQILVKTASNCTTAESAHRLALVWRHLGTLVRWTSLTDMVDHILIAICQK